GFAVSPAQELHREIELPLIGRTDVEPTNDALVFEVGQEPLLTEETATLGVVELDLPTQDLHRGTDTRNVTPFVDGRHSAVRHEAENFAVSEGTREFVGPVLPRGATSVGTRSTNPRDVCPRPLTHVRALARAADLARRKRAFAIGLDGRRRRRTRPSRR